MLDRKTKNLTKIAGTSWDGRIDDLSHFTAAGAGIEFPNEAVGGKNQRCPIDAVRTGQPQRLLNTGVTELPLWDAG